MRGSRQMAPVIPATLVLMESLRPEDAFHIACLRAQGLSTSKGKVLGCFMRRFSPYGTVTRGSLLHVRALDDEREHRLRLPANLLARLAALLALALCFGLAARFLVGAP